MSDSSRISPTAHYTSYVWVRAGLSPPSLASPLGRALYLALWPPNAAYARLGGRPNLEAMLLARHQTIDRLLARAVEAGEVRQVIEIAAGFSGRGLRFAARDGLTYVEGDLAPQAAKKRRILDENGLRGARHEVVALDALRDDGPESLAEIARARLRPDEGCAIITEGLIGYFDPATVIGLWRRIARVLATFPRGLYLSDINFGEDVRGRAAEAFRLLLGVFARGQVHLHFQRASDGEVALRDCGFGRVALHPAGLVQVIEARP